MLPEANANTKNG